MVQLAVLGAGSSAAALRLAFPQNAHAVAGIGLYLVAMPPGLTLGDLFDLCKEGSQCRQATDDDSKREFDSLPDHKVHNSPFLVS